MIQGFRFIEISKYDDGGQLTTRGQLMHGSSTVVKSSENVWAIIHVFRISFSFSQLNQSLLTMGIHVKGSPVKIGQIKQIMFTVASINIVYFCPLVHFLQTAVLYEIYISIILPHNRRISQP